MNRLILIKHKTYKAWINSHIWLKDVGFPLLRTFSPAFLFSLSIGLQVESFVMALTVFCILSIGTVYIKATGEEINTLKESIKDLKRESTTTVYTQAFKDRYVSMSELKKEDFYEPSTGFYEPSSMYIPNNMHFPNYPPQAIRTDMNRFSNESPGEYPRELERNSDHSTQFGSDSGLVGSVIHQALENIRREQGTSVSLENLTFGPTMINLSSRRGRSSATPRTVLQSYMESPTGRPLTPGEWGSEFYAPISQLGTAGEIINSSDLWERVREEQEPEENEHI